MKSKKISNAVLISAIAVTALFAGCSVENADTSEKNSESEIVTSDSTEISETTVLDSEETTQLTTSETEETTQLTTSETEETTQLETAETEETNQEDTENSEDENAENIIDDCEVVIIGSDGDNANNNSDSNADNNKEDDYSSLNEMLSEKFKTPITITSSDPKEQSQQLIDQLRAAYPEVNWTGGNGACSVAIDYADYGNWDLTEEECQIAVAEYLNGRNIYDLNPSELMEIVEYYSGYYEIEDAFGEFGHSFSYGSASGGGHRH